MQLASGIMALFSILVPAKLWFAPTAPIHIDNKSDQAVMLVLTDFAGKAIDPKEKDMNEAAAGKRVDLRTMYPGLSQPGTYLLFAVPKGKTIKEFVGTPLVIQVRAEKRQGMADAAVVVRVEPLRYAVMSTDAGDMTMIFYYDVAPKTALSFLTLSEEGYYDGLTFHRILPGFVIQGGDPAGDGTGGPGFNLEAEFNDRKHEKGVLSMARKGDPLEQQGMRPRFEFANSAGSQFFVCLENVPALDNKYTAFGKVVAGLDTVATIARTKLVDERAGKPEKAPVVKTVSVKAVTAKDNPYAEMLNMK